MRRMAWSFVAAWLVFWVKLYMAHERTYGDADIDDFIVPVIAATVAGLAMWGAIGAWGCLRARRAPAAGIATSPEDVTCAIEQTETTVFEQAETAAWKRWAGAGLVIFGAALAVLDALARPGIGSAVGVLLMLWGVALLADNPPRGERESWLWDRAAAAVHRVRQW